MKANRHGDDEEYLERAAGAALPGEEVLAAGIFSRQDTAYGQAAGASGGVDATRRLERHGAGGALAALAVDTAAAYEGGNLTSKRSGMTLGLLVAVTPARIVVLNWEGDAAGEMKASFARDNTDVVVKRLGFAKLVNLVPADGSPGLKLQGTTARLAKQSGPDKVVLHLLSEGA